MKALWIVLALLAAVPEHGTAGERVWRVGLLSNGLEATGAAWRGALFQVLGQNGFDQGKNLELIERYSAGHAERLPQLAREIADAKADAIMAISVPSVRAALAATKLTPIVSVGGDPVAAGLADGYAHPGGRVTGIAFQSTEGDTKRLQLLSEAMPNAHRFGYLGIAYQQGTPLPQQMAEAATRLGVELIARWIDGPGNYDRVLGEIRNAGAAGVVIGGNQPFGADAARIAASALKQGLPAMCEWDYMARAGCPLSYGHDLAYGQRRAAEYVARILKGASPEELPIERSDAFRLTVNRRAAERLGLGLPSAILARADEVIE
jgi:ABC-type uncharacterized transport system substrate-binding protein